jgi:hypothetical protein
LISGSIINGYNLISGSIIKRYNLNIISISMDVLLMMTSVAVVSNTEEEVLQQN